MKANYFFSADLTSKKKFDYENFLEIKGSLEMNEDFLDICSLLSGSIEFSFNRHIEIYIEDHAFDSDIIEDLENFMEIIDDLIPGGWSNDSKVEWTIEIPEETHIWYKEDNVWKNAIRNHDRGILGEEEEWNNNIDDDYTSGYGMDLDDSYGYF
jgi:hypothetical protein